jgi:hypothetical protein
MLELERDDKLPSWRLGGLQKQAETEWQKNTNARIQRESMLWAAATSGGGNTSYRCYKLPSSMLTGDDENMNFAATPEIKAVYALTGRPDVAGSRPSDFNDSKFSSDGNMVEIEVKTSFAKKQQVTSSRALNMGDNKKAKQSANTPLSQYNTLRGLDYMVLAQAFERVIARIKVSGFRKRAFAFAVSNQCAWMVDFNCDLKAVGIERRQITFTRLDSYASVDKLWHILVRAPDDYVRLKHTTELIQTVTLLNMNAATTRIRWHAFSSQAIIYQLTPCEEGSSNIPADGDSIKFAVKVFLDDTTAKNEIFALGKYKVEWEKKVKDHPFYATQYLSCDDDNKSWALTNIGDDANHACVLLMHNGQELPRKTLDDAKKDYLKTLDDAKKEDTLMKNLYCDILDCLHMLHRAKICHCDVRRANILNFNGRYVLIDLGLSKSHDSKSHDSKSHDSKSLEQSEDTYMNTRNGQYLGAGRRVTELGKGRPEVTLTWEEKDDLEMLTYMLLGLR